MNGPKAVDNEQWELLGGQPLFGGTHRLQSHAENGAIFHAPLYSPTTTVYILILHTLQASQAGSTYAFTVLLYVLRRPLETRIMGGSRQNLPSLKYPIKIPHSPLSYNI